MERTFQGTRGVGKTLGLALLMLLIVVSGVEGYLRVLVGAGHIPRPSLGSLNAELDIKLALADDFVQKNGRLDCLFFGSSQFDSASNPSVFASQYTRLSGQSIHCFNFCLGTLTAQPAGPLAQILVNRYHPRLLIYGTSARDYSTDFGELTRPLLRNGWVRAQLGEPNLEGWLVEHSMAYRWLLGQRGRSEPDYWNFLLRLQKQLRPDGFLSLTGNSLKIEDDNFIPKYTRSDQDMRGLDSLLQLSGNGVEVVVVEVPVQAAFLNHYVQASANDYQTLFQKPIATFIQARGVPFWLAQDTMQTLIPDQGWADVKHLNERGAVIYSTWLAERVLQAADSGQIHFPAVP